MERARTLADTVGQMIVPKASAAAMVARDRALGVTVANGPPPAGAADGEKSSLDTGTNYAAMRMPAMHIPDPLAASGFFSSPSTVLNAANRVVGAAPNQGSNSAAPSRGSVSAPVSLPGTNVDPNQAARGPGQRAVAALSDDDRRQKNYERSLAFQKLVSELEGRYSDVKPRLANRELVRSLRSYGIQVVDDEGLAHGAGDATCRLRYQAQASRLARDPQPACRARDP
jgi:hypothetical protein